MKTVYLIGGAMGVGKTTVSQQLKKELTNSVFLDGDWCWDADPFQVTDETKAMVMDNICYLLNNFLHCSTAFFALFSGLAIDTVKIDTSNKSVCEIAIVVCKEYQNRHIGRRCVLEMLKLAKEKGMGQVTANIYSFNRQSQRMFRSVGFEKTTDEWYAYKL